MTDNENILHVSNDNNLSFTPFYDVIASWFARIIGVPAFGAMIVSFIPGGLFLLLHYSCTREASLSNAELHFHNLSWLIGIMITMALMLLYYGTYTLKALLFQHLGFDHNDQQKKQYTSVLNHTLSNRHFLTAGLVFGILNVIMGAVYGVPYQSIAAQLSIFSGYFIVGFVCGMPAWGIYGVLVVINILIKENVFEIDYTAPDGCGGLLFVGTAIIKFSSITLIMGVVISIYILFTWWINDPAYFVKLAIVFWVAFPYLCALIVFAVPTVQVNGMLVQYKIHQEKKFSKLLADNKKLLAMDSLDTETRVAIETKIEYLTKERLDLYKMFTWPFGKANGFNFGLVVLSNLFVSFESLLSIDPTIKQFIHGALSFL